VQFLLFESNGEITTHGNSFYQLEISIGISPCDITTMSLFNKRTANHDLRGIEYTTHFPFCGKNQ
ncbi:MAG TPA: hypothetical protein VF141_04335, partial [Chryseolinea sp.]